MAVLTDHEKRVIRNAAERKANSLGVPIRWIKNALDDVSQAIEDRLESNAFKVQVSNDIDNASTPHGVTFTNAEKTWLFAFVIRQKFERDK